MKIAYLAAALALTAADEGNVTGDPQAELVALVSCTANEMTLMHGYAHGAAIIGALSQSPQLEQIKTSYQSLAAESQKRIIELDSIIDDTLIPQVAHTLGAKPADLQEQARNALDQMMLRSALSLSNPGTTVDELTALQRQLIERSQHCESLANAVQQEHKV